MKKILLVLILLSLIFSGCSTNSAKQNISSDSANQPQQNKQNEQTNKVPEPYSKAMQKINEGDLSLALTYLDLTMKDANDSKYIYNSHLFKSIILRSKMMALSDLMEKLGTGAQKGTSLYSIQDIDQLEKVMKPLEKEYRDLLPSYSTSTEYIYTHYVPQNNNDVYNLELTTPTRLSNDFKFFSDVGYPVPKDVEVSEFKEKAPFEAFRAITNELLIRQRIDYPHYFYIMASGFIDNNSDLQKNLVHKIIEITENDKYNEYRIKANEFLNNK